jgi:hypothetical protein
LNRPDQYPEDTLEIIDEVNFSGLRSWSWPSRGSAPDSAFALNTSTDGAVVRGVISIISAPASAPQTYVPLQWPPPAPRLDRVDLRIIEAVREHGPVKLWSLLNWLAQDGGERSRTDGREARRALWDRVKRLKRLGLVFGRGRNEIATTPPPARRSPRRRRRTVSRSPGFSAVSADKSPSPLEQPAFDHLVERQLTANDSVKSHGVEKPEQIESAISPEETSAAARALATLPRRKSRKWTGWLHGQHCWRGRPVVLPNGEVTEVYWASHDLRFGRIGTSLVDLTRYSPRGTRM